MEEISQRKPIIINIQDWCLPHPLWSLLWLKILKHLQIVRPKTIKLRIYIDSNLVWLIFIGVLKRKKIAYFVNASLRRLISIGIEKRYSQLRQVNSFVVSNHTLERVS